MTHKNHPFLFLNGCLAAMLVLSNTLVCAASGDSLLRDPQAASSADKLLTISDVEAATGVKGLKLVPKNPAKGAGGDLNFAKPDGSLLVMAIFGPASLFKQWKAQPGFAGASVMGIGDEAFTGSAGSTPYAIFLRKGDHAASISSFLNTADMKPLLSQDQLKTLAKTVASRL